MIAPTRQACFQCKTYARANFISITKPFLWLYSFNYKHGSLIDMKFALAYVAHQEHSYLAGAVIANSYYQ